MSSTEKQHTPQQFQLGDLTVDLERYTITRADGTTTPLTAQEQQVLRILIAAGGNIVTHEELSLRVSIRAGTNRNHAIRSCVQRLRNKLQQPHAIPNVHSLGYRLNLPPAAPPPQAASAQDTHDARSSTP